MKLEGSPPVPFLVNETAKGAASFVTGIRKCGSTMMDCVFDKVKMIGQILAHFGWTCSESSRAILLESVDVRPQTENPEAFIRKVTLGNHREKLSPETTRLLNRELAEIPDFQGYAA